MPSLDGKRLPRSDVSDDLRRDELENDGAPRRSVFRNSGKFRFGAAFDDDEFNVNAGKEGKTPAP